MKHPAFLIPFLLMAASAPGQSLTDVQVAATIKAGGAASGRTIADSVVCFGNSIIAGGFDVCAQGPIGRIALRAYNAKKAYREIEPADIEADVRSSQWLIEATPNKPEIVASGWRVTPPAMELLIQAHGAKDSTPIRALSSMPVPRSWSNALGAKFEGQGMMAYFDPAALPAGDLDVIVLVANGEVRYHLKAAQRSKIQ